MYKIIDGQGGGLKKDERHATLESVRESLASFHSIDVEGAEQMSLIELCEIGTWSIEDESGKEVDICPHEFNARRDSREKKCKRCGLIVKDESGL